MTVYTAYILTINLTVALGEILEGNTGENKLEEKEWEAKGISKHNFIRQMAPLHTPTQTLAVQKHL